MTAIRLIATGRVAFGVAATVAPPAWLESVFGASARGPTARALAHTAGVRDVALGAATLAAARSGRVHATRLAMLGALCDAADAAIGVITPGLTKRARTLGVPMAVLAAGVGGIAAWQTSSRR